MDKTQIFFDSEFQSFWAVSLDINGYRSLGDRFAGIL